MRGFNKIKMKKSNCMMWALLLPGLIYILIFHYLPMFGLIIAFKDYNSYLGIWQSPWADMHGLKHFYNFLTMPDFWRLIWNTLSLSLASLLFATIPPVAFALLTNEIIGKRYKKFGNTKENFK